MTITLPCRLEFKIPKTVLMAFVIPIKLPLAIRIPLFVETAFITPIAKRLEVRIPLFEDTPLETPIAKPELLGARQRVLRTVLPAFAPPLICRLEAEDAV